MGDDHQGEQRCAPQALERDADPGFERGGVAVPLICRDEIIDALRRSASRLRPGLNHMAFRVDSGVRLSHITSEAEQYGWSTFPSERHAIAGGADVAYLEDRDGFEVELVSVPG